MKVCSSCKAEKPLLEFHKKGDGRHSMCKPCRAAYVQAHYRANRSVYLDRSRRQRGKVRKEVSALKETPCVDCGIQYPSYVMQFDHVTGTKIGNVSSLASVVSKDVLAAEIEKCEVVCSNCHAERTHQRGSVAQKGRAAPS